MLRCSALHASANRTATATLFWVTPRNPHQRWNSVLSTLVRGLSAILHDRCCLSSQGRPLYGRKGSPPGCRGVLDLWDARP